jgi:hypothetical protein
MAVQRSHAAASDHLSFFLMVQERRRPHRTQMSEPAGPAQPLRSCGHQINGYVTHHSLFSPLVPLVANGACQVTSCGLVPTKVVAKKKVIVLLPGDTNINANFRDLMTARNRRGLAGLLSQRFAELGEKFLLLHSRIMVESEFFSRMRRPTGSKADARCWHCARPSAPCVLPPKLCRPRLLPHRPYLVSRFEGVPSLPHSRVTFSNLCWLSLVAGQALSDRQASLRLRPVCRLVGASNGQFVDVHIRSYHQAHRGALAPSARALRVRALGSTSKYEVPRVL